MLTSRYTSVFAYFSTNLEMKRQESTSVHTTFLIFLMTRSMDSVVVYLTLSTQNKQSIHYMDITYVYIAFYYSTTHQSHVKQTCEAVCPLNKYFQKFTFRSFQYTYCTSKLLLALEFFLRKMCQ